jgi:glycosyltransferase 2 family protein
MRSNPSRSSSGEATPAPARLLKQGLGYLIALACLVWIFHDVHPRDLWLDMKGIRWWWVVPAILLDVLSYLCQGIRWALLLGPPRSVSPLRTTQAIYAGLFTNELFPLRLGEVVRAYLISRWTSIDLARIVPSMAVERFFDGIWVAAGIGIAAIFIPLPKALLRAGDILGGILLAASLLFLFLVLRRRAGARAAGPEAPRSSHGPLVRIGGAIARLGREMEGMGRSRRFYFSLVVSSMILVFQALAFWLILRAYGLELSIWIGAIVLLIVHIGTALPNAPGNIGTYQFFCIVGLTFFGVGKLQATGFSLVVFVLLTVPLWAIGSLALSRSGVGLRAVRRDASRWMLRGRAADVISKDVHSS